MDEYYPGTTSKVAADREETDFCQCGTQGCCIDHASPDDECHPW